MTISVSSGFVRCDEFDVLGFVIVFIRLSHPPSVPRPSLFFFIPLLFSYLLTHVRKDNKSNVVIGNQSHPSLYSEEA